MAPLEALQLMYAESPDPDVLEAIETLRSVARALRLEEEGQDEYMINLAKQLCGEAI